MLRPLSRTFVATPIRSIVTRCGGFHVTRQLLSSQAEKLNPALADTAFGTGIIETSEVLPVYTKQEASTNTKELEIKDARVIFDSVWHKLLKKYGDKKLTLPTEITFLMGAPGSGKGTNTGWIQKSLGITSPPIVMSSLLTRPEMKAIMDSGSMISDGQVLDILLEELIQRNFTYGAIVDGFPRTYVQVECTKLLYDKMMERRRKFFDTELRDNFRRPVFRIAVLYVDENESVRRQLLRGNMAKQHNEWVRNSGQGQLIPERATDMDEELIRKRYSIFKQHYSAMLGLKDKFQFHLIDASGTLEQVRNIILKEFDYQSSLELDQNTHDIIQHIPLAVEIGANSRQELIRRLDSYQNDNPKLFKQAADYVLTQFVPAIRRHSIAGRVLIRCQADVLENPLFVDMILDILSERGFHVNVDIKTIERPTKVDKETLEIQMQKHTFWHFQVAFQKKYLRLGE